MSKFTQYFFTFLLLFFIYHLVRDILQIYELEYFWVTVWHRTPQWCRAYCDYTTLPHDFLAIGGSISVLREKRLNFLGKLTLLSVIIWPIAMLIP